VKLIRHTEHRLNTGEYSSVTIGASVELDSSEFEGSVTESELIDEANRILDLSIADDLDEVQRITSPKDNHIHEWKA
jgi:hypothetical protein